MVVTLKDRILGSYGQKKNLIKNKSWPKRKRMASKEMKR